MGYYAQADRFWPLIAQLCEGMGTTLMLFALTLLFAIPLGLVVSAGSMTHIKPLNWFTRIYVLLMRGTPLMLQVMFMYFGLNILHIPIPRTVAGVAAFVLNYAAYFGEIFRGGIQSIDRGQHEAAEVLGLTKGQTMQKVVLPQVFKRILPSLGNEVITLVKDTALVSVIAVYDLMKVAGSAVSKSSSITPYVIAAVFYLLMNAVVTRVLNRLERRVGYYR